MDPLSLAGLGLLAGLVTTGSLTFEIYKVARIRSGAGLSWRYILGSLLGLCLWFYYGMELHDFPLIYWNVAGVMFWLEILALKICFRPHPPAAAQQGPTLEQVEAWAYQHGYNAQQARHIWRRIIKGGKYK